MRKERAAHFFRTLLLLWLSLFSSALFGLTTPAQAAPRETLTFQARVLSKDRLIAPTGRYSFRFTLYSQASGGTPVWQESWVGVNEVALRSGLFSVALGSITPLTSLDWSGSYYLGVEFDGDRNGSVEQLFGGRIPLSASPYSLHANTAETAKQLEGGITAGSLLSRTANEAITGSWVFQNGLRINGTTNLDSSLNGILTAESGAVGSIGRGDLTGTANQINVSGGSGALLGSSAALSLPQDIASNSAVQFSKLGLGASPGTARLTLATATSPDGGISFGSDAYLYRSGSEILRTDAALRARSLQSWLTNGTIYTQDHLTGSSFLALRANPGKEMYLVWTEDTVADRWTMGIKPGDSKLYLGAGNPQTNTNVLAIDSNGSLELPLATSATSGLLLGTDTNLYRSAANTLRTDDALTVGGELTISHTAAGSAGQSVMISSPAPVLAFDDTNQAAPAGKLAIRAAGITDALIFLGRNSDDTGWNQLTTLYRQTGNFLLRNQADLLLGDADSSHSAGFQAPAALSNNLLWTLPSSDATGCLSSNGSGTLSWSTCSGGSGAPVDAAYLTLSSNSTLSGERTLLGTTNQVILTDGGANGNLTLSLPQSIATTSTVQLGALGLGTTAGTSALVVQQAGSSDIVQFKDVDSVRYVAINGNGQLGLYSSEASNTPLRSYVAGESVERFHISASGGLSWGNGTDAIDTVLYRSGANTLATPDALSFYRSDNATLGLQVSAGSANNFLTASSGGIILLSAAGVDVDSSTGFGVESQDGNTDYFRVNTGSGLITMPQATSSSAALVLGGDANLYRVDTNALATDGQIRAQSFKVNTNDTADFISSRTGSSATAVLRTLSDTAEQDSTLTLARRSGSNGSITDGWDLGSILFSGRDGASTDRTMAYILAQADGSIGNNVTPGRLIFAVNSGAGQNTEALRISSDQKLWIGGGTGLDTNLYRSAANTLKTDDSLVINGDLTANIGATTLGATLISTLAVSGNTSVAASISGVLKATSGLISAASAGVDYQAPITWGDGLTYSGGTADVDYNATNLKITSSKLNTIQDIATNSAVQFGSVGLGRAASNQTPLSIGGTLTGTSYLFGTHVSPTMTSSGNHVYGVFIEPTTSIASGKIYSALALGASQSLTVTSGAGEVRGIQITEPQLASGTVATNAGLYIGAQSIGTTNYGIYLQGTGVGNAINWQGDTNLYRSAAAQLTTDGQFIAGSLSVGTNDSSALVNLKKTGGHGAIHLTSISDTTNDGSGLELMRQRNTGTILQSDDRVGQIVFRGWDDGTYGAVQTALIQTFVDGTPGPNDMPGRLVLSTTPDGGTVPLEALRIDSSQKLWIGGGAGLDTNLYRSAANTLKTDDTFSPLAIRNSSTSPDPYIWEGAVSTTILNGIIGLSLQPTISSNRDVGALTASLYSKPSLAAGVTASGIYSHLRVDDVALGSGASLATQYGLYISSLTSGAANAAIYLAGTGAGNGITFGTDTNLYRGAANELRTDDLLSFSSSKTGTAIDFKSYKTVNATNKVAFIFDTSANITSGSLLSIRNNGVAKFTVTNAGNLISSGTLTQNGTAGDVAENIPVSDPTITAGDIVTPDPSSPGKVRKATAGDQSVAGVISTDYAILLAGGTNGKPLALTGRVPVKVSEANGLIRSGDVIVTSATPGVGVRASATSSVVMIGVALTDQAPGASTVMAQLQPGYYTTATGSTTRTAALSPQQQGVLDSFSLLQDGSLFTARLTVQRLTVKERLAVEGDLEVAGTARVGALALPTTQSGTATLVANEDRLFVPTAAVRSTDRILLTPRFDGSTAPTLSRGEIKEGEGFWVHRTSPATEPASFDWLLIH